MMTEHNQKMGTWQGLGFVACILAIVAATLTWVMVMVVNSTYHPLDNNNWPSYVVPTIGWIGFSAAAGWVAWRLKGKNGARQGLAIAAVLSLVGIFAFGLTLAE